MLCVPLSSYKQRTLRWVSFLARHCLIPGVILYDSNANMGKQQLQDCLTTIQCLIEHTAAVQQHS